MFAIGSLGDSVMAVPVLRRALAEFGDSAAITVLHDIQPDERVQPHELFAAVVPGVASIGYPYGGSPLRRAAAYARLMVQLRRAHLDVVVNATTGVRSARALRRDSAYFRWCGISTRIGFEPAAVGVHHEAAMRLSRLAGFAASDGAELTVPLWSSPPSAVAEADTWLTINGPVTGSPMVALCIGSHMPSKNWPEDRFAAVAAHLLAAHDCTLVVVGGPAEQALCDRLVAGLTVGRAVSAAGALSALGTAELLRRCALLVTLDTGSMHLAAAQGTPTVALFSQRIDPARWAPIGDRHEVLSVPVDCAGCEATVCTVPGHPCMDGITVDAVIAAAERVAVRAGIARHTVTSPEAGRVAR